MPFHLMGKGHLKEEMFCSPPGPGPGLQWRGPPGPPGWNPENIKRRIYLSTRRAIPTRRS